AADGDGVGATVDTSVEAPRDEAAEHARCAGPADRRRRLDRLTAVATGTGHRVAVHVERHALAERRTYAARPRRDVGGQMELAAGPVDLTSAEVPARTIGLAVREPGGTQTTAVCNAAFIDGQRHARLHEYAESNRREKQTYTARDHHDSFSFREEGARP